MNRVALLKNTVQNYAWGSHTDIPELLGESSPSVDPQAELWMGTHPKAPSEAKIDGQWVSLDQAIQRDPVRALGNVVAGAFNNTLPFLFKVLAAGKPLSIQAHPSISQAKEGYARENKLKIPLGAPNRNYKDDNHKPECICALSSFWALNGFRKIPDILSGVHQCCPNTMAQEIRILQEPSTSGGLKKFFESLMSMPLHRKESIVQEAVQTAKKRIQKEAKYRWLVSLQKEYPTDIGILSPLFLNLILLEPGQAMYLPAGELHAYLEGVAIELMANSDNVLRGGLTTKHIDVSELLKVLNFQERNVRILYPVRRPNGEGVYVSQAKEFELSVITTQQKKIYTSREERSAEILLCTAGTASLSNSNQENIIELKKGNSIFIPASVKIYRIAGDATFYKASVPI